MVRLVTGGFKPPKGRGGSNFLIIESTQTVCIQQDVNMINL
jgi:hypothetical protein